ncbi:MAG: hypothetical protein EBZ48_04240 [Proteobacteria bacterium]|nr:hypothetical protein [Pseudomonadota bacterium]
MNTTIPEMWRLELLHPVLVHFPIALLLVASVFEVASLIGSVEHRKFLRGTTVLLFVLGTAAAWAAVWAGEEAGDIVQRTLCSPDILELHEDWGERSAWIFTLVTVLSLLRWKLIGAPLLSGIIVVLAVAGSASLGYAGHLGATLVYQQGAAVYRPSADCTEFKSSDGPPSVEAGPNITAVKPVEN